MAKLNDLDESTLELMKGWSWGYIDPDGVALHRSLPLNEALNRLAFADHPDPSKAILALLCEQKLVGICDFQWLKFRGLQRFQVSDEGQKLNGLKWRALQATRRDGVERRGL